MTEPIILHPSTASAVASYMDQPVHAILLTGPAGSGRMAAARHIASYLLAADPAQPADLDGHAYVRVIRPVDGKAIPIETIRELQHFLSLRIPGGTPGRLARAIIIEDSQLLTIEAQNALLKTLEEPPADTFILMTATGPDAVLPTISSRTRHLAVLPPRLDDLTDYFTSQGHSSVAITQAILLSGGLAGMTAALLNRDQEHPLMIASTHARGILQSKTYERLLLVDSLSKQKQLTQDILFVLGRMARTALLRSRDSTAAHRWRQILSAVHTADEQLAHNTQAKLVLTNLLLSW